jgi:hypothetical protein
VGPTRCFPNRQFTSFPSQPANSISNLISFPPNVSDVRCTIFKNNYFNEFSSIRAFQRYIICKIPSPFEFFSIFDLFSTQNRVSREEMAAAGGSEGFSVSWDPLSAKGTEWERYCNSGEPGSRGSGPHVIFNEKQTWYTKFTQ